jgi:hypothetical protein
MENDRKYKSSVQYQMTHIKLFDEVFCNAQKFSAELQKGPAEMKKYLFDMWNQLRTELKNNEKFEFNDIDKGVTIEDFDITFNKTRNGTKIFFVTLPDYEYRDAAAKYIALAITNNGARYFTLEYSEHMIDHTPCWVIGEWAVVEGKKQHKNYGTVDNMRLSFFAGRVIGLLESQSL